MWSITCICNNVIFGIYMKTYLVTFMYVYPDLVTNWWSKVHDSFLSRLILGDVVAQW
jgi:hypothetical protein